MSLKAVIFDLDGTLLDWSGFSGDWVELRRKHLQPVHDYLLEMGHKMPDLEEFANDNIERTRDAWFEAQDGNLDAPHISKIMTEALAGFGLDIAAIDMETVIERIAWGQVPGTRLYDGVLDVLKQLQKADLRVGLLTNASYPMWMRDRELRSLGIEEYFDCRVSACDVGKLKPHGLPFEHTLECLDVSADSAVFVGDSLVHDIAGANGVGMRTVWHKINDEVALDKKYLPDATIDRPQGLLEVLDGWYMSWRNGS